VVSPDAAPRTGHPDQHDGDDGDDEREDPRGQDQQAPAPGPTVCSISTAPADLGAEPRNRT
jgi:hypothetical protein